MSFANLLDELEARAADRPAVVTIDRTHSRARLVADVRSLGARLRARTSPASAVTVRGERGYDALVALLACLTTGRTYVPLDPQWPQQRCETIVEECAAQARVDIRSHGASDVAWTPRAGTAPPDDSEPGYIIFTSGSTGTPKGVRVSSQTLLERIEALAGIRADTGPLSMVLNTSIGFDISLAELLLPFVVGGTVVCPPPIRRNVADFAGFLNDVRPTLLQATPSLLRLLNALDWPLPHVPELWCGGELLDAQLAAVLLDRFDLVRNLYGPTEATIWCSVHTVTTGDPGSVGYPIGGSVIRTLPTLDGVGDELVIGGAGLAQGYLRRTDEVGRFVDVPGLGRAYRTGDAGRVDADGRVHVVGRLDDQVKVNGHRLELAEVEAALLTCSGVRQAAVIARDVDHETRLEAFVVAAADSSVNIRDLRQQLGARVPTYALPRRFTQVESLPLTTAGKLDRQALRQRAMDGRGR